MTIKKSDGVNMQRSITVFMALLCFGGGVANAVSAIHLFMARTDFQQFLWHAATALLAFGFAVVALLTRQNTNNECE
ncbi:hypothetical protein [Alcaligenes sp. SMD-FA]|uniref:hypothetical protein n=1 Tax=Alcaligenes sp. SMD-FA TaxID=2991054 RepID=UPI002226DF4B|nr:hypothetical protein [Alcaligenes sp. SMD-FA]UYY85579.1 hypothetical protein OKX01_09590 [Alcaligenes sp. SMD-FA]